MAPSFMANFNRVLPDADRAVRSAGKVLRQTFGPIATVPMAGMLVLWLCLAPAFGAGRVSAAPAGDASSRAAMQLLKTECFACHNPEKKKGGLVLTTRERLLEGSDSGAVVVPGKPDASLLTRVLAKESDPHMPPKKQLSDAQVKTIRQWIKDGLVWNAAVLEEEEAITPVELGPLPGSYQPVLAMAFSPDGARLAFGRAGQVTVIDTTQTNFPVIAEFEAHRDAIQSLAWSRDGRWLASGAFRRVALWDGETFTMKREWTNGLTGRVTAMEFSREDESKLVLADGVSARSGFVRVLDANSEKPAASWRAHEDTIFDLDLSRDGKQLVTAGGDKLIKVWDLSSKKEVARLEGHGSQVLAVAFNSNATQVVSGGADKQLKVWDVDTRHTASSLGKHSAAITAVAWSDDGASIVAITDGGMVSTYKNLKAHSGKESSESADERKFGEGGEPLLSVAVAPDRKRIITGSHDGTVQVWSGDGKLLTKMPPPAGGKPSAVASDPNSKISRPKQVAAVPSDVPVSSRGPKFAASVVSLTLEPKELRLSADAPRQGVLVTAHTTDGFEIDVTAEAKLSASRSAPFEVLAPGEIQARRPGNGTLTARFRGRTAQIPVKVDGGTNGGTGRELAMPSPGFVRDVLPALSKAGCNAGPCHAKPEGQNGFRLSVFSYDPKSDYAEIVKEDRGRRVFPAAPDESLIIQKPTTAIPHEGGLRFDRGSDTHQLLLRWLREGMPYSISNEPALQRITVFPKERRYQKGATQRLLVHAHYSDGSVRDVTRLAGFDSNDKEIAKVDERGLVAIGTLTGQGVVVARYMGFVADSQILVPADRLLPEAQYAALPKNNFIDEKACAHFQRLGLFPSELCTDAEFLRRASLDSIGMLPTATEAREFLGIGNAAPPADDDGAATPERAGDRAEKPSDENSSASAEQARRAKRRALIDRLLDHPAYADYWANKWADLLRPNPDRVGVKSVFVLDQWLRESFRENKPYDQFVREILLAEGSNHRDGPAVIYRDRREPPELTTMFTQLFLGTRFECAKCHHHPNEKWSQDDFYEFAAFFGPVKQKGAGLSPPISGGTEMFFFAPGGKGVKHPVTGEAMSPRPPDGPRATVAPNADPRRALADWLTAPDNPFFARAAVNRVWAVFFGRGLVEPADDFRISNPCVNPPLLDALAEDFARHGYDLKHLIRTIMESRLYQLSSIPNESNLADTRNFSRAYRRRLPAEVLLDAVNQVTGVPDTFPSMPIGSRATQAWTYKMDSQLMDAFSRPNPSSDPPCERDRSMSVVQSLHLMNSKALQSKLAHKTGRARQLAESPRSPQEIVLEAYLTTLNRPPTREELQLASAAFSAEKATRQSATEDVFWALLNSAEFVFNH